MAPVKSRKTPKPGDRYGRYTILAKVPKPAHLVGPKTYWECLCDCGERRIVATGNLTSCSQKSCGSYLKDLVKGPRGDVTLNVVEHEYRTNAARRDLEFNLSREQFRDLIKQECHYCGTPAPLRNKYVKIDGTSSRINKPLSSDVIQAAWMRVNGVDRKDSDIGYQLSNCVPCCARCNVMKNDLPYEAFIAKLKTILKHLGRY